jgi:hypothetical protein
MTKLIVAFLNFANVPNKMALDYCRSIPFPPLHTLGQHLGVLLYHLMTYVPGVLQL